jgi:hypothetical protein
MATQNNIFMTAGEPIARFTLTPKHGITGWRLNPDDNNRKVEWALTPTPEPEFDYERDVIELYSDKEVKFFKQANRYLLKEGLIREFEGTPKPIDITNMLTDEQVMEIATDTQIKRLKNRLAELTSKVSVDRIYRTAIEIGRPAKTLELMKERLDELT